MKNYKRTQKLYKYFKDNNLDHSVSAKEDNARYNIYKVFDDYYFKTDEVDLDLLIHQLSLNKSSLEYLHNIKKKEENDNRSGEETYGYIDSESIKNNLVYISDKCGCQFRIRWILDLIELKSIEDVGYERQ